MASPRSPRVLKAAAIADLQCSLYDTFRAEEGQPPEVCTQIVMKKEESAPADVVDMSDWARLDAEVRRELSIEPDPTKFALKLTAEIHRPGLNRIMTQITGASSLYMFRKQFDRFDLADIRNISEVKLLVLEKPPQTVIKHHRRRTGKHAVQEKKTRDLSAILYGDAVGKQHLEGLWGEEADFYMAKNPVRARMLSAAPAAPAAP